MTTHAGLSGLLARATSREVVRPADGKSQSTFERLTIDGQRYFLKSSSPASDWVTRVSGDNTHRPYLLWRSGFMHRLPSCIDHAVVSMDLAGTANRVELRVLMRDVEAFLVPEGDAIVRDTQHRSFIEHLAELSVSFWGWKHAAGGLTTMEERLRLFGHVNLARELAAAEPPDTLIHAEAGWRALSERAPRLAAIARAVHENPSILTAPLAATPVSFLHGDWKMGNLGSHPDGRTILLDWTLPGFGPACWDLCWYLALNRARLPESKEATIGRFRAALEDHALNVSCWFDTQLDLCTVGIMATFGWEKALGDDDELRWWERHVMDAIARQRLLI